MDWSEKSIYSHVFSGVATDHNLKVRNIIKQINIFTYIIFLFLI